MDRSSFLISILFTCLFVNGLSAQSVDSISHLAFIELVKENHPLVKQAALKPAYARQNLKYTRGAFDPVIGGNFDQKVYSDVSYYRIFEGGLKVPTWIGADFKLGFQQASGSYLNPQNNLPQEGLAYAGVTLPVLRNLIIDRRRADVRQAGFYIQMAEAERINYVNKVLFDASKVYWDWYFAYQKYVYHLEGFQLADVRYDNVKNLIFGGDLSAIDSVEAFVALLERQSLLEQSILEANNARQMASAFLWSPDLEPVEFDTTVVPQLTIIDLTLPGADSVTKIINEFLPRHPEMQIIDFRTRQLKVERNFARSQLLPELNVGGTILQRPPVNPAAYDWGLINSNHKVEASLYLPIFLRKERAKLAIANIEIDELDFDFSNTLRNLEVMVSNSYAETVNLDRLREIQLQVITNSTRLRDGEQERFLNGESSFFLVNTRETRLIDAQIKGADFEAKMQKAKARLAFETGLIVY